MVIPSSGPTRLFCNLRLWDKESSGPQRGIWAAAIYTGLDLWYECVPTGPCIAHSIPGQWCDKMRPDMKWNSHQHLQQNNCNYLVSSKIKPVVIPALKDGW